jgi:hypothetical protein
VELQKKKDDPAMIAEMYTQKVKMERQMKAS